MSDDELTRYTGSNHLGKASTSPYPVSRLAPAIDLVDVAKQIVDADAMVGAVVGGKLGVIAEQIRALQAQAREILTEAHETAALHRAKCRVVKRPGSTYHLYREPDETLYFSMLSPAEWGEKMPHEFVGSYRLEADMSWTPAGAAPPPSVQALRALVGIED